MLLFYHVHMRLPRYMYLRASTQSSDAAFLFDDLSFFRSDDLLFGVPLQPQQRHNVRVQCPGRSGTTLLHTLLTRSLFATRVWFDVGAGHRMQIRARRVV